MITLEQIFAKHNFNKRTDIQLISIVEVENKIGFKLPEDYQMYLKNYLQNECSIGFQYLRLWALDDLLEMNTGYEIFENLPDTVAIGTNGGGEFIAIELTDINNYRLVLSPFIDLDKKYHVEIGNSFTDFFQRLENGIEWFK